MPFRGKWQLFAMATLLLTGCGSEYGGVVPTQSDGDAEPTAAAKTPRLATDVNSRSTSIRDVSFDDIAFEMEKGSAFSRDLLPERVLDLRGQPIRIRGYILPSFQQTGLTQFVLVRDNMECCFGPGAALYDCIVVKMQPGHTADFSIRPVAVTGVFDLTELKGPDGNHLAIYALAGETVR